MCLGDQDDRILEMECTSSPQIHQKYPYILNNSHGILTECWQKTRVFRVLSAISHLSVKKHLKPGHCVFPERWWWLEVLLLFLFSCTKSSEEFVINSYNCVLILFQPFITFLLFHFISLLFIILLDSILLSLVKYFLESYELLCFHYYLYWRQIFT